MRRIILASTSPRRKTLLEQIGLTFEQVASDYEEDMTLDMPPSELVKFLSKGKADSVAKDFEDALVIAADTIVEFEGEIFGKPHTPENSFKMLSRLNGTTHSIITGMTIIDTASGRVESRAVVTEVDFRDLKDDEIQTYVDSGEALDKAGAYGIQGLGVILVKRIRGDYSNIVGLPLTPLVEMLKDFGVDVLSTS
ncbi:MAG: septum formation inhibitor Maf [Parcubacteria group bacterium]|nr:septum formation inhibitor Maf [Parcubacteria group bacterium]